MNICEWLNYRKNCPLCEAPLTTYLHSSKRQSIRWIDGRMVVIFPLRNEKRKISSDYNVGYSFSLTENQFCIDFWSKNGSTRIENIPLSLTEKFKNLDKNLGEYRFYRQCKSCERYHYSSSCFKLDFKTSSLKNLVHFMDEEEGKFCISSEYFGFVQALEKGSKYPYRIFRLLNCYIPGREGSHITYWCDAWLHGTISDWTIPNSASFLDLPLVRFISPDDTISRIQKLLVFS